MKAISNGAGTRAAIGWFGASVVALACAMAAAAPYAGAHGSESRKFESTITSIEPASLEKKIGASIEQSDELRVQNLGDQVLIVFGYNQDQFEDPYLRIAPNGVFVNKASAAYYQNQGQYGAPVPDGIGDKAAAPRYVRVRMEPLSYTFHDHRVHYMAEGVPANVDAKDPDRQKVYDWSVPIRYGATEGTINGTLFYVGGKEARTHQIELPLTAAGVVAMIGVFAFDWRRRRRRLAGAPAAKAGADKTGAADE